MNHIMNEITIPNTLHERCVAGIVKAKQEQRNSTMNKHIKKYIAASVAVVLSVCVLAGTNTALADSIRGFFSDIIRFDGAIVGTAYHNTTEEIKLSVDSLEVNKNAITIPLHLTFLYPTEAPYPFIEEISLHNVTITDTNGNNILTVEHSEIAPLSSNFTVVTISIDRGKFISDESYSIHFESILGHSKGDSPLQIDGSWSCSFIAP